MQLPGIIGGMGPDTTADFYRDFNRLSVTQGDEARPEMVVWNIPLNYGVEQGLLKHGTGLDEYLPLLIRGAQFLERAGVDFIAIPCNTVHELYPQFKDSVEIPFLHIVEATANSLSHKQVGRAAVLATGSTIRSGMYHEFLGARDIEPVVPSSKQQARIDSMVADLVFHPEMAKFQPGGEDFIWFNQLAEEYAGEVGTVVLGCTDFHALLGDKLAVPDQTEFVDSTKVLVAETLKRAHGEA